MDISQYLLNVLTVCSLCTPVCVSGLLTVQTMKSSYTAEYGGEVTIECRFPEKYSTNLQDLTVIWKHTTHTGNTLEVAKFYKGKDAEILQDKDDNGRVKMLSDELLNSRAVLQITNVTMTDAGQYLCIISSQGSDYKEISLEVQAPYKQINTKITDVVTSSGQTMKELSCQSLGYPMAEVTWLSSGGNISAINNISYTVTAERLFNVTSVIRIPSEANRTYTCIFWNRALQNSSSHNFTFIEIINNRQHEWITAVIIIMLLVISIPLSIYVYGHHKGRFKKRKTEYSSIHLGETLSIDNSASSTSKYSEYNSVHNVISVVNT